MSFLGRMFARDVVEISRSPGHLVLIFVAPVVFLILIGHLNVRAPTLRVAIVAASVRTGEPQPVPLARLEAALEEISSLEVVHWPITETSLRERAVRDKVDVVVVSDGDDWRFHTPLTNNYRTRFAQAVTQDVALSLQRYARLDQHLGKLELLTGKLRLASEAVDKMAAAASAANLSTSSPARSLNRDAARIVSDLAQTAREEASVPTPVLRAWLANQLDMYFPPASNVDHSLVPGFIGLIAVFLPFLLASGAVVREREAGTLQTMIISARRNWALLAAGKLLMPLFVGLLVTLLLLVAAKTAFGFDVKPGLLRVLSLQLLAAAISGLFGLSISTLIKSSQDAYTISSAYLVACILVTGLIYPVEQAAKGVAAVAFAFPLTLAGPILEDWILKGASAAVEPWRVQGLFVQLMVAVALCAVSLQNLRKSL